MIDGLKPYPKYKNSGVPWLGDVPEHWEVRRMKTVVRERVQKGFPNEPLLAATQSKGVVKKTDYDSRTVVATKDLHLLKLVEEGDLVISLRSFQGGIEAARHRGIISPAYTVLVAREPAHQPYLAAVFKCRPFIGNLSLHVTGIRQGQNIEYSRLSTSEIPLPPRDEQLAIVRLLRAMNQRSNCYIRAKKKLTVLLNEQKQAIIHRAVTRGVDPNVPLKPSGVEWLGNVPEHWDVMPLRRLTISRCDGPFGSGLKSLHYTPSGIRVVRLQNIGHGEFKASSAAFISPEHYETLGDHSVIDGDLLIAGLGDERHPAGRACVAPASIVPAMVKADCFRFRLDGERLNPEFAALQLTATAVSAAAALSKGSTRQRTNLQNTAARSVAVPPLAEQISIADHVAASTGPITNAIETIARQITLILELQTRVVADMITGKLDVRDAAARLPADESADEILEIGDTDDELDMEHDAEMEAVEVEE